MTTRPTTRLETQDIQGLVVRGYGRLPQATFLLFGITATGPARTALTRWAGQVASAESAPAEVATNLAFTAAGLRALSGGRPLSPFFSPQFASGMVTTHRSRLLGDLEDDAPERWGWGGPGTPEVHLLLLVYGATPGSLQRRCDELERESEGSGLQLLHRLTSATLTPHEAFGFRDGLSQPRLEGLGSGPSGQHVVRAGEFVLGYPNEYGQLTPRPLLPGSADPGKLLPRDPEGSGAADLGRNGSYLVFRQLSQDVDGFRAYLDQAATDTRGHVDVARRDLLAAKMMGRWPSGAPLVLSPEHDQPELSERNDFGYHVSDPDGFACPVGSHVRRTNPRDSLPPEPGTEKSLEINRRHRLLRRGRAYGDPSAGQGLHFICLNANLARQYEFVQHTWVNNPAFHGLYDEDDPVVGPRRSKNMVFTEPARPVRRRCADLPQFVHVRGGGYFFLPGVAALRYLSQGGQP